MKRRARLALASAALLSGCVSFRAKPIDAGKAAAAFDSRSLADPGLRAFARRNLRDHAASWPPAEWDLDALVLAAFYFHPDLDVARAQWATARSGEKTAGERPNPSLNLSSNELFVANSAAGVSPWVFPAFLDVPIETAGKRGIRLKQAKAASEAARMNLAQAAWTVRSRVRAALAAIQAARRSAEILEHQQAALAENERLLTERARNGQTSPLNAAQAVILAGRSRLSLEDARRQESDARSLLAAAVGVPARALEEIALSSAAPASLPAPDGAWPGELRRAALLGRADLLSALADYQASEAALELEIARQYPDVHLSPGYMFDQGLNKYGVGFTFPIPILNRNRGPIAEAEGRRKEAGARFLGAQDRALNDIDRAVAAYRAGYRKLSTAKEVLKADLEQDQALRRFLRPGDVSRLTLFRSQLDIDSSRLAEADAQTQAEQALAALEDALEQPMTPTAVAPGAYEADPRAPEGAD